MAANRAASILFKSFHRPAAAALGALRRHRIFLILLASTLLLTGCVLSAMFQSLAGGVVAVVAALVLAACGSGGGGGGGGSSTTSDDTIVWPATVDVGQLTAATGFIVTTSNNGVETSSAGFGKAVAAGDVTGDGIDDLVIGAPFYNAVISSSNNYNSGVAFVLFGDADIGSRFFSDQSAANLNISLTVPGHGVRLFGAYSDINAGAAVAVGDLNGDSVADVIVGVPETANTYYGRAFVVFGSSDTETDFRLGDTLLRMGGEGIGSDYLDTGGAEGFEVTNTYSFGDGGNLEAALGSSLAVLDINGDSVDDVAIGAPLTTSYSYSTKLLPRVGLVFGQSDGNFALSTGVLDLDGAASGDGLVLGGGFSDTCYGPFAFAANSLFGDSLAGGRVDSGVREDLIIGMGSGTGCETGSSVFYPSVTVVPGNTDANLSANFSDFSDYDSPGFENGFSVFVDCNSEIKEVTALGDVNGDSIGDFAITEALGETSTGYNGKVHVIFGKSDLANSSDIDLTSGAIPAGAGFTVITGYNEKPVAVLSGVDLNKDGVNDIIIANRWGGAGQEGSFVPYEKLAYVIFGGADVGAGGSIDMSQTTLNGSNGFVVETAGTISSQQITDVSLATADLNGDGTKDLIVGVPFSADYNDGAVYVIFGRTQ